jgi:hypothetical protein
MSLESTRPRVGWRVPKELINIAGTAAAVFLAVWLGGLLASLVPAEAASVWLTAGAYLAPAAAMFALYWVIAQRL